MVILIDNGHGSDTVGKCSPDGRHREYKWARDFAGRLCAAMIGRGHDARRLVTEEWDVSIQERVRRAGDLCAKEGSRNVLLLSMHNDAKGSDGKWHEARGFSARVGLNASDRSKLLATMIAQAMDSEGVTVRKPLPRQWYWPQNLGICRDTHCPAVLCENLFQDNREDVRLLHDEEFLQRLAGAYVKAIEAYINIK
jgi:N-acetylmuramoyl-L-alanine amidase